MYGAEGEEGRPPVPTDSPVTLVISEASHMTAKPVTVQPRTWTEGIREPTKRQPLSPTRRNLALWGSLRMFINFPHSAILTPDSPQRGSPLAQDFQAKLTVTPMFLLKNLKLIRNTFSISLSLMFFTRLYFPVRVGPGSLIILVMHPFFVSPGLTQGFGPGRSLINT